MTANFTKKRTIPARLLRIQNATMIPTTATAVMATAWPKVIGVLLCLLSTSLLTDPMLRSRHGR